ncbi:hypothetical protein T4D_592 [Trichinella pseudospiralis]|uniref:Uncharacterized protein n=1 Tax=Trichinella pseudospiralis TaxID=6337 RepID=A0A0V1FRG3_TRIPS|nr:hypothetical protein T4D_592 [Trichinella pseudospiralis]
MHAGNIKNFHSLTCKLRLEAVEASVKRKHISFDIWTLFYKTECRRLLIQYIIISRREFCWQFLHFNT